LIGKTVGLREDAGCVMILLTGGKTGVFVCVEGEMGV